MISYLPTPGHFLDLIYAYYVMVILDFPVNFFYETVFDDLVKSVYLDLFWLLFEEEPHGLCRISPGPGVFLAYLIISYVNIFLIPSYSNYFFW